MLQKSSIQRTLQAFFDRPTTQLSLIDISRAAGLAHTSVKKNLTSLAGSGLITETMSRKGQRIFPLYQAQRKEEFLALKRAGNISAIIESGIDRHIRDRLAPRCVVLFGSYQRGEDTEGSDIDLFIECETQEIDLSSFEKSFGKKIETHFNPRFGPYPEELRNNIINGLVLCGFLKGYDHLSDAGLGKIAVSSKDGPDHFGTPGKN